ncbi:guanylate kinase [Blattabacterium cuenoti]|uniref:guanylate kinase n=1 Tax=Blattabacterium cuenoti TaxID=1653831 RepID=UPI00293BC489|nr:guanylate kinase [Blattabacterium cuenoti]
MMKQGKMIILSGSSGSGKTTISNFLLSKIPLLKFSISCTTRTIRPFEIDKKDYFFLSKNEFINKINNHHFIEWEEVYPQLFYGTLKEEIFRIWNSNYHVLFDVDVKGGINLKTKYPNNSLSIFLMVNSIKTLENRLIKRNSENYYKIYIRLKKAATEWKFSKLFDIVLINLDLSITKEKILKIVSNFIFN